MKAKQKKINSLLMKIEFIMKRMFFIARHDNIPDVLSDGKEILLDDIKKKIDLLHSTIRCNLISRRNARNSPMKSYFIWRKRSPSLSNAIN